MRFEVATAGRILFGAGVRAELAEVAAALGRRAAVLVGSRPERHRGLVAALEQAGIACTVLGIPGEPTTRMAHEATESARAAGAELVVAIGGGSVLDAGKAVAALLTNGGEPLDYLEVVGRGRALARPSAPMVAVPTTAGTGSEVTRNAVLTVRERAVKVSLRSPLMLPRVALVDPELTHDMPPAVTASTGLDALTQLLEPFVCIAPNPLTDGLCREGLGRAARSLERAFVNGGDVAAREDMAVASLFGGMALANAKLGAVHGFAGPLGGMFDAPHGAVCARLLPFVMEANVAALASEGAGGGAAARYDEVAGILTGRSQARAADGVAWVKRLCEALSVPPLAAYGVRPEHIDTLLDKSAAASSMKGNPVRLTREQMRRVLEQAI